MLLGYARISTDDQKTDLQHDALRANGCDRIFDETASGAAARLPVRDRLLDFARPGDAIVVWKLDRLGRSLRDLIDVVTRIGQRSVALRSLHGSIDTATPAGTFTFHVFAALSEFERDALRERSRAGLAAARTRPPPALDNPRPRVDHPRRCHARPRRSRGSSPNPSAAGPAGGRRSPRDRLDHAGRGLA